MTSIIRKVKEERAQELARKRGIVSKDKVFDVDAFDRKVATSTARYHREVRNKQIQKRYDVWCDKNIEHLKNMYDISGQPCDFDEFCTFTFDHSFDYI